WRPSIAFSRAVRNSSRDRSSVIGSPPGRAPTVAPGPALWSTVYSRRKSSTGSAGPRARTATPTGGTATVRTANVLTLEEAELMLDAAVAEAQRQGVKSVICISDAGGWPIALRRMDGGKPTSVEIAINKAFTAACHRRPTHTYTNAQPNEEAFGIMTQHGGRFTIFVGGWPIALRRMDGGKPPSVEIAINKAFTAACHRRPTHTYTNAQPNEEAFGIMTQHGGRFTIFVGGWPIEVDGEVVGGVGVSGGHT